MSYVKLGNVSTIRSCHGHTTRRHASSHYIRKFAYPPHQGINLDKKGCHRVLYIYSISALDRSRLFLLDQHIRLQGVTAWQLSQLYNVTLLVIPAIVLKLTVLFISLPLSAHSPSFTSLWIVQMSHIIHYCHRPHQSLDYRYARTFNWKCTCNICFGSRPSIIW